MIGVNDLKMAVDGKINKKQSGHILPSVLNLIIYKVSMGMFNDYIEKAGQSQSCADKLASFLVEKNLSVTKPKGSVYGLLEYPTDYSALSIARAYFITETKENCPCPTLSFDSTMCNKWGEEELRTFSVYQKDIDKVTDSEWGALLNHVRLRPTINKPAMKQDMGGFIIAPKEIGIVALSYYKKPARAKWGYTQVGDWFQFDQSTSVDLDWSDRVFDEFVDKVSAECLVALRDPEGFQMTLVTDKNT